MFTWSLRVGCKFLACRGESMKYQTCLILFLSCLYHFQACMLPFQACPYHFQACPIMKPACLLQLKDYSFAVHSQHDVR